MKSCDKLEIVDADGDTLDIGEVYGMGRRCLALFVTSAENPNDIEGVNLSVENAMKLRDWLNTFIGTKPALAWTKEPPTVAGYWWHRRHAEANPCAVLVTFDSGSMDVTWCGGNLPEVFGGGEWYGPIEVPPA